MTNSDDLKYKARPGDLLFYKVTPQSWWVSKLIAVFQIIRSEGTSAIQYSHVSVVMRDTDYQVEAVWPRVRKSPIDWSDENIELYRINRVGRMALSNMVTNAIGMIGQLYDLGQFFFGLFPSKQRKICTSLVVESAKKTGVILGSGAGILISPNELRDDKRISPVR